MRSRLFSFILFSAFALLLPRNLDADAAAAAGATFFSHSSSMGLCCSRVECDIPRSFRAPYKLRLRHTYVGVAGDAKIVPR